MHETMLCGVEMPILTVRHVTAYYYKTPVAFGEHRMMLRPRDDDDQQVLETKLEISPKPSQLTWTRDSNRRRPDRHNTSPIPPEDRNLR
jgi:transglutaminase-like putative cysteine protease